MLFTGVCIYTGSHKTQLENEMVYTQQELTYILQAQRGELCTESDFVVYYIIIISKSCHSGARVY